MRICLLLLGICLVSIAGAQRPIRPSKIGEEERAHILKASILSPMMGTVNVHYEKRLNEMSSFQFEVFYFGGQLFARQLDIRGLGLTANYRFYLTQQFPRGWFIQPFLRYQRYWPTTSVQMQKDDNAQVGGMGVVFGYQVFAAKRITLDAFAGPMYSKLFVNDQSIGRSYLPVFNGPWIRLGVTLGFLF
jgi:Protein of unknown function (DUF3575)